VLDLARPFRTGPAGHVSAGRRPGDRGVVLSELPP